MATRVTVLGGPKAWAPPGPAPQPHGCARCRVSLSSALHWPFIWFLTATTESQGAILRIPNIGLPQEKALHFAHRNAFLGLQHNGVVLIKSKYKNQQMTLQLPPDNRDGCFLLRCQLTGVKRTAGKLLSEFSTREKSVLEHEPALSVTHSTLRGLPVSASPELQ